MGTCEVSPCALSYQMVLSLCRLYSWDFISAAFLTSIEDTILKHTYTYMYITYIYTYIYTHMYVCGNVCIPWMQRPEDTYDDLLSLSTHWAISQAPIELFYKSEQFVSQSRLVLICGLRIVMGYASRVRRVIERHEKHPIEFLPHSTHLKKIRLRSWLIQVRNLDSSSIRM